MLIKYSSRTSLIYHNVSFLNHTDRLQNLVHGGHVYVLAFISVSYLSVTRKLQNL